MILDEVTNAVKQSWSKETCCPGLQSVWNEKNPSLGQCAITALIVNDFIGGKIMRCMCGDVSHYYNLVNNSIIDITASQFGEKTPDYKNSEERSRNYLLSNEDTKMRYILLLTNVKNSFIKYGKKDYLITNEKNEQIKSKIPGTLGGHKKLKIYGKLDCPSALKWINKGYYVNNRVFFLDEETANKAGYRPCSVCMPEEYKKWKDKQLRK